MTATQQLNTVWFIKEAADDQGVSAPMAAALGASGTAGGGVLGSVLGGMADPKPKSMNIPGIPDTRMDRHLSEYFQDAYDGKPEAKKGFSPYLLGKNKFRIGGGIGGAVGGAALTSLLLALLSNKENSKSILGGMFN